MTKEKIILAALRLFLERGYSFVALTDVAQAAGMTKGGVYYYFTSKEQLVYAVFQYLFEQFETKYLGMLERSLSIREVLEQSLVVREMEGNKPGDLAPFAIEATQRFPDLQSLFEKSYAVVFRALCEKFAEAARKGEIKSDVDSEALAGTLLSMLHGCNLLGGSFYSVTLRQQMADNLWKLIMIG